MDHLLDDRGARSCMERIALAQTLRPIAPRKPFCVVEGWVPISPTLLRRGTPYVDAAKELLSE
jgi:hypothetical protein